MRPHGDTRQEGWWFEMSKLVMALQSFGTKCTVVTSFGIG